MKVVYKTPINEKIGNAIHQALRSGKVIEKFILTADEWEEYKTLSSISCGGWAESEMFMKAEVVCEEEECPF